MKNSSSESFLKSDLCRNPLRALEESLDRLNGGEKVQMYLHQFLMSDNPKDEFLQYDMGLIMEVLLEEGKKEEAGLLFNIHRTLTEFRGYGANDEASSDVLACFGKDLEIPEEGVIEVDFFVTRNLPKIIQTCEERGVDLSRIRVCAPKGALAAQLLQMSSAKKVEFEVACSKLQADQFIIKDVNHNADIRVEGDTAVWFSPRTMPITPKLHGRTEQEGVENYCAWFRNRVSGIVKGGRIYANLAYSEEWQPLEVEMTEGRRPLAKLTGMSKGVASRVAEVLTAELGFRQLGEEEFNPADFDARIDHAKLAKRLHLIREK